MISTACPLRTADAEVIELEIIKCENLDQLSSGADYSVSTKSVSTCSTASPSHYSAIFASLYSCHAYGD